MLMNFSVWESAANAPGVLASPTERKRDSARAKS